MSKLWAHLGTLLALLGATSTDVGAFHAASPIPVALTAVAGVLCLAHLVAPSAALRRDLSSITQRVEAVLSALASSPKTETAMSEPSAQQPNLAQPTR